jgi:ankyrin repeat protein
MRNYDKKLKDDMAVKNIMYVIILLFSSALYSIEPFQVRNISLKRKADNTSEQRATKRVKPSIKAKMELAVKAIADNNFDKIKELIQEIDINTEDSFGTTMLTRAVAMNKRDLVRLLLEAGASPIAPGTDGLSIPFFKAVLLGNVEQVQIELDGLLDKDPVGYAGFTPLLCACSLGYIDIVWLLLEHGVDPRALSGIGKSPLMYAVQNGHHAIVEMLLYKDVDPNRVSHDGSTSLMAAKDISLVSMLLDAGAYINATNKYGYTALIAAIEGKRKEVVRELIARKADVEIQSSNGNTALITAAETGELKIVEALIEAGADVNKPGGEGWTPLMYAAFKGNLPVVKKLLDAKAEINAKQNNGATALTIAIEKNHCEVVKELIKRGAAVEIQFANGNTALTAAIDNVEMVDMLIEAGADVNKPGGEDWTPLMYAAFKGNLPVVIRLLESEASINAKNKKHGCTALAVAVSKNHREIVKELIKRGAAVEIQFTNGDTALTDATGNVEMVDMLLKAGAMVDKPNTNGTTPLMRAAHRGNLPAVLRLLRAGANIDAKNMSGNTALTLAIRNKHKDVVKELLAHKASYKIRLADGNTALITAACSGELGLVNMLIEAGANVNETGWNGWTPLMFAARDGHLAIVRKLLEKGAQINAGTRNLGFTAVTIAIQRKQLAVLQELFAKGATCHPLREIQVLGKSGMVELLDMIVKGVQAHAIDDKHFESFMCHLITHALSDNHQEFVWKLLHLVPRTGLYCHATRTAIQNRNLHLISILVKSYYSSVRTTFCSEFVCSAQEDHRIYTAMSDVMGEYYLENELEVKRKELLRFIGMMNQLPLMKAYLEDTSKAYMNFEEKLLNTHSLDSSKGVNTFMLACLFADTERIQKILSTLKALGKEFLIRNLLNEQDCLGRTALMYALIYEHRDVVKILLPYYEGNRTGMNVKDEEDRSTLFYAVRYGDIDLINTLRSVGARFAHAKEAALALKLASAKRDTKMVVHLLALVSDDFADVAGERASLFR